MTIAFVENSFAITGSAIFKDEIMKGVRNELKIAIVNAAFFISSLSLLAKLSTLLSLCIINAYFNFYAKARKN